MAKLFRPKYFLRLFLQVVFVIMLLEILLRIILYQQFGLEKLATIESLKQVKNSYLFKKKSELVYKNHLIARRDSTDEVNRLINQEAIESNYFEYFPWSDYKNIDYKGRYINVEGVERRSVPNEYINLKSDQPPIIIRFFGGSTMYGYNSADAETIPSAFVNLYKRNYPYGRSIRVINNGICAYHSYNEMMLLSHLLFSGNKTDIVIFLDGLNDLFMAKAVYERVPYFYYKLRLANNNSPISKKEIISASELTQTLFQSPQYLNGTNISDSLLKRYLENIDNIKNIANSNSCKSYFFIQPNPYFNYPNQYRDPICTQDKNDIVSNGYQKLEKLADTSKNIFFLGNMIKNEKGVPFIDKFHYSPSMSIKIAAEIIKHIGPNINSGS